MKRWYSYIALLLCLVLAVSLCACNSAPEVETTAATAASTEAVQIDPVQLYEQACAALDSHANLVIAFDSACQRTVGGEIYTEETTGTASYTGLGSESMEALVNEDIRFGTYQTQYIQSYLSGCGYCRANNCNFVCTMTAEDFLADQLPAQLLSAALYGTITAESDGTGTVLTFTDPLALESWIDAPEAAQLITAYGTVTLDADGCITAADYHAEYTVSIASYTLELSMTVETPSVLALSASQPVYPEDCPHINDLSIPRLLMQVVGDVYTAQSMTVSYTDWLYSEAFVVTREQSGSYDTYGADSDFTCGITTQVALTNYSGVTTTNSQSVSYRNGVYSYTTNGSEPEEADNITAEQVRTSCEDSVLASLFELAHIADAVLTDSGDFLCIQFTGNETYTEELFDSIYSLFSLDLDSLAQSFTTDSAGGYVVINKYTMLPTSMGMSAGRTHVIDDVSYQLTYQLDQSLELSSQSAYRNITGQSEEQTPPLQSATPLFYKVTGENGETMWLLGTIHLGDARTAYLPNQITEALDSADALAVEFNALTYQDALTSDADLLSQLAQAYYYGDGTGLIDHLPESLYGELSWVIQASGCDSASGPYTRAALWNDVIESFYLTQGSSLTTDQGVDTLLLRQATEAGTPVYEIESYLSQIQMLTGFSDELQALLLQQTLDAGLIGCCQQVEALYELWCQGDEAALTEYLSADTSSLSATEATLYQEYVNAMYTQRNAAMLTAATDYLASGETVFYAVGLAHLLGDDGLVASLRAAGFTVELVSYE